MNNRWEDNLPLFQRKMQAEGMSRVVRDTFGHFYQQVCTGDTGLIRDEDISPILPDDLIAYEDLDEYAGRGRALADQAVMIRLNGGLGTSMGLTGPKSLLPVKNGLSFLEIILGQAEHQGISLALMNSFKTHTATMAALRKLAPKRQPRLFIQNKFPKIQQESLKPVSWPADPSLEWTPPGHGDVFTALSASGILADLLDNGVKFVFIANVDNLGATMDPALLGYFAENHLPFMMEVAEKSPADVKGGHLARRNDGRLTLRELAQCPQDERDTFRDIRRYPYFNTNNIWVNLERLQLLFEKEGAIHLPIIVNPKTVDPRDEHSPAVYQIETAMGAAMTLFEDAVAVKVDRNRFMPIKKCDDLLAIRSDCYLLDTDYTLYQNPIRSLPPIHIQLDKRFFNKIDEFDNRFAAGIPSLVCCESLTVEGDVAFEADVTIKGQVVIKNGRQTQKVISAGTIIDNQKIM